MTHPDMMSCQGGCGVAVWQGLSGPRSGKCPECESAKCAACGRRVDGTADLDAEERCPDCAEWREVAFSIAEKVSLLDSVAESELCSVVDSNDATSWEVAAWINGWLTGHRKSKDPIIEVVSQRLFALKECARRLDRESALRRMKGAA